MIADRELPVVWRICVTRLSGYDASSIEDVCQEVFVRWLKSGKEFSSPEHEKAWFIKTTLNLCADVFRHAKKAPLPLDECEYLTGKSDADENIAASEIIDIFASSAAPRRCVSLCLRRIRHERDRKTTRKAPRDRAEGNLPRAGKTQNSAERRHEWITR